MQSVHPIDLLETALLQFIVTIGRLKFYLNYPPKINSTVDFIVEVTDIIHLLRSKMMLPVFESYAILNPCGVPNLP